MAGMIPGFGWWPKASAVTLMRPPLCLHCKIHTGKQNYFHGVVHLCETLTTSAQRTFLHVSNHYCWDPIPGNTKTSFNCALQLFKRQNLLCTKNHWVLGLYIAAWHESARGQEKPGSAVAGQIQGGSDGTGNTTIPHPNCLLTREMKINEDKIVHEIISPYSPKDA